MLLDNNEHSFPIKQKCAKTLQWYEGSFTVKCVLTNDEQIDIALRTDRYNQGSKTLAPQYALMNRVIAELEVRILRDKKGKLMAPTWWVESDGGRLLHDPDILFAVFNASLKAEETWREKLTVKADAAQKTAEEKPRPDNPA